MNSQTLTCNKNADRPLNKKEQDEMEKKLKKYMKAMANEEEDKGDREKKR